MIDMRLKKQASVIPTSIVETSNKLSDDVWGCAGLAKQIIDQLDKIDEETYNENYDELEELKSKLQQFEDQLSDISEYLQNVK